MKKRLISLVLSVVTTLSAVSALNVTALDYYWGTTNNEAFSDCIEIEDYSWLFHPHKDQTIAMYLDSVNSFTLIYDVTTAPDSIVITVPINEDILKIEDSLKDINENLFFSSGAEPNKDFIYCNITSEKISMERACGQKVGRKECTNQCTVTNNERKRSRSIYKHSLLVKRCEYLDIPVQRNYINGFMSTNKTESYTKNG